MSDLLSTVGTVISSFTSWLTDITISLLNNDIVQITFALIVVFFIVKEIINIIIGYYYTYKR